MAYFRYFLIAFLSCLPLEIFCQITHLNTSEVSLLTENTLILEDPDCNLSIETVSSSAYQSKFKKYTSNSFSNGVYASAFWLKFTLHNVNTQNTEWLLYSNYSFFDYFGLFYQNQSDKGKNTWQKQEVGMTQDFQNRHLNHRFSNFLLKINPDSSQTYYLKIYTETPFQVPLRVQAKVDFQRETALPEFLYGIFAGIMLLMLFNSIFNYFSLKEKPYLHYLIFIIGSTTFYLSLSGHITMFFLQERPIVIKMIMGLGLGIWVMGASIFTRSFLGLDAHYPILSKLMKVYFLGGVAMVVMVWFVSYQFFTIFILIWGNIGNLIIFVSGLWVWYHGYIYAKYFAVAWFFYVTGTTLLALMVVNVIPNNFLTSHLGEISSVFEIIMFSLALSHKSRIKQKEIYEEKDAAKAEVIAVQKAMNEQLELKVLERTKQVQEKRNEVAAQNEELLQRQEELFMQNEVIEKQNMQLREYSENLEGIVEKRTEELSETNEELMKQNAQLEQFGFIVAHNLRSPVAQLLGLTSLFNERNIQDPINLEILQKIRTSADWFNEILYDLNVILEVKKGINQAVTNISLESCLAEVMQSLSKEIQESQTVISINLSVSEIKSVLPYIRSVFYNLIGNAIKYQSKLRKPAIDIKSSVLKDKVVITVQDNGLGIDLKKYKNKVFGLYQRFHLHKEGKGMGLYLCKTQIESLGGTVEVRSELEVGTCFTIVLPHTA